MKGLPAVLLLFLFVACQQAPPPDLGFYHWKTSLSATPALQNYLEATGAQRIYLHLFDVDWDATRNEVVPQGILSLPATLPFTQEIIPTVFLTNRSLLHLSEETVGQLAERLIQKAEALLAPLQPAPAIREWQLDCDWTDQSRDRFFALCEIIRSRLQPRGIQLSTTIRLHQIKFRERTGVPPVDRGMLMFYNTGQVTDPATYNSILDLATAGQYYQNMDQYPLPLDLALPLFSWGVVFREGRFVNLINNLRPEPLQDDPRFTKIDGRRFQVAKSTYLEGYYLYAGDQIRLEWVEPELLEAAARQLQTQLAPAPRTLTFYHLDSLVLNHYPYEALLRLPGLLAP